jgi:hypothetical protein
VKAPFKEEAAKTVSAVDPAVDDEELAEPVLDEQADRTNTRQTTGVMSRFTDPSSDAETRRIEGSHIR